MCLKGQARNSLTKFSLYEIGLRVRMETLKIEKASAGHRDLRAGLLLAAAFPLPSVCPVGAVIRIDQ